MEAKRLKSIRYSSALLIVVAFVAGCGENPTSEGAQSRNEGRQDVARADDPVGSPGSWSERTSRVSRAQRLSAHGKPRPRDGIFLDRLRVETLFLTEDGQSVEQPMHPSGGVVVDAEAGTVAWFAWQCNNPSCPGRADDGSPFMFSRPYPFYEIGSDGSLIIRSPENDAEIGTLEEFSEHRCPECLAIRDLANESESERRRYDSVWCKPHVLRSAAARLKELEAEHRAVVARERQQRE